MKSCLRRASRLNGVPNTSTDFHPVTEEIFIYERERSDRVGMKAEMEHRLSVLVFKVIIVFFGKKLK